jgi:hypothetical protein
MTAKHTSELSRRDALKLLGAAAGATVLANLPSRWSTPELTAGVLPAHAQTSGCTSGLQIYVQSTSVQDGTPVLELFTPTTPPDASELVWGAPGSSLSWDCDPPCILFMTRIQSGSGIGSFGFMITVGDQPGFVRFIGNNDSISDSYWIYVNAATGAYSEGTFGDPIVVEGCPEVD